MTNDPRPTTIPQSLVDAVLAGDCVAFVGAGFSAGAIPSWRELLATVAGSAESLVQAQVASLTEKGTGYDLEVAAQILRDHLGEDRFGASIAQQVSSPDFGPATRRRSELIRGIPFRTILTTNFDAVLAGQVPGRDAYLSALRSPSDRWWDHRYWDQPPQGAPVVKLHGDAGELQSRDVVFTRRDYRTRLYSDPAYMTFLRSMFATTTLLYLGVSFSDAYLNELRSEVLALLDYRGGDQPVAYAVLPNVSDVEQNHLHKNEGIDVISYDSVDDGHTGFDDILETLFRKTNPRFVLGERLNGRRLMWVDPGEWDADYGMEFLREAAGSAGDRGTDVVSVRAPDEALRLLGDDHYDLVITHWGHSQAPDGSANGEYLLDGIRRADIRVPVIVFASGAQMEVNKPAALSLGALAYTFSWDDLFRKIADLFA